MKKVFVCLWLLLPLIAFAGCNDDNENNKDQPGTSTVESGKILIAYFSRWGNTNYAAEVDASSGASIIMDNGTRRGTTAIVADYIQAAVGGDVLLIETTTPYPVDFDAVRDLNHDEQAAGTLPALKMLVENMDQYDIIFVGYPVWAIDVPQAIHSFLSSYDLTGKTVVPFCTHDGYGAGNSFRSVREAVPGANVLNGISIESTDVPTAENDVKEWLDEIGVQEVSMQITAGGKTFTGEWLNTPLAREIRGMFPLTATLGRYGDREYYGSMPRRPTETEEGQLHFENGDITYCPSNNTIAIFYAKDDDPSLGTLTMRVIPIGKVTSGLEAFNELDSRLEFTFDNIK